MEIEARGVIKDCSTRCIERGTAVLCVLWSEQPCAAMRKHSHQLGKAKFTCSKNRAFDLHYSPGSACAQLGSAQLGLAQLNLAWLSSAQLSLHSAQLSLSAAQPVLSSACTQLSSACTQLSSACTQLCSAQLSSAWGGRGLLHPHLQVEPEVCPHYCSKCVICLLCCQTTALCSRQRMAYCGMQALLSPGSQPSPGPECGLHLSQDGQV